ncbi:glycosyltransferase [Nocardioides sp. MAH-18]|uniref:Glycosyltransferase n=1 Tax=Nocardioides agri TaxID=2682843 RepID=A0A6L6XQZ8_9ACTN|nr:MULTISPECIES: glycosyltransferase [unclassified Nocardioides]MBA2954885.1 glycosyltransferase [Nocardioides sp. CGMCC 1.13656]MVQ49739.1 glycosyltransferase [Nocardioides sp. MAH-18]
MTAADQLRVLVVNGESMHSPSPTGVTLSTVLGGLRPDQVLELTLSPGAPAEDGRAPSLLLPGSVFPLRHLARRFLGGAGVAAAVNQQVRDAELAGDSARARGRTRLRALGNAYLDLGPVRLPRRYRAAIRDFAPHVVYTAGCTIGINRLALAAGRVAGAPVLMHYLDNWRESLYAESATWLPRRALARSVRRVEAGSGSALVISDRMGEAYGGGRPVRYFTLMNAAEPAPASSPPPRRPDAPLRVVYTGGLHLRRHESMLVVEEAVRELRDAGTPCELVIHLSPKDDWLRPRFDPATTTFAPYVAHDQLPEVYAAADVLVHAESFDPAVRTFIRYSISTKISEYLAAGRPILCYAPAGTALQDYVSSSGAGLAPTSPDDLRHDLRRLATDPGLRATMGAEGRRVAHERHTPEAAHATLEAAIRTALSSRGRTAESGREAGSR